MAISQRYVSAPHDGDPNDTLSRLFRQFYDRKGPKESFRQDWQNLSAEQRKHIRSQFELLHDRMMANFRDMPSELMLIFRYFELGVALGEKFQITISNRVQTTADNFATSF